MFGSMPAGPTARWHLLVAHLYDLRHAAGDHATAASCRRKTHLGVHAGPVSACSAARDYRMTLYSDRHGIIRVDSGDASDDLRCRIQGRVPDQRRGHRHAVCSSTRCQVKRISVARPPTACCRYRLLKRFTCALAASHPPTAANTSTHRRGRTASTRSHIARSTVAPAAAQRRQRALPEAKNGAIVLRQHSGLRTIHGTLSKHR